MADPDHRSDKVGKVSDSVYSNSYNSQTTRSHSSNSAVYRLSDSRSSGSSGYGGNPSSGSSGASGSHKKKKEVETKDDDIPDLDVEAVVEDTQEEKPTNLSNLNVTPDPVSDDQFACEETSPNIKDDDIHVHLSQSNQEEHFSCVVAMQTGLIIYSTTTLCNTLGYPQEMWVGRSFIDFVNPRDQAMFATQVSNMVKASMCMSEEFQSQSRVSVHCRLRQYNGLASSGFGIKSRSVAYMPFKLILSFYSGKNGNELDISGEQKEHILSIGHDKDASEHFKGGCIFAQATSMVSAFKAPLEILAKGVIFTLRHSLLGVIEHIDAISIPYLGYMPHDLVGKCAIKMYHPEDLGFLRRVYEVVLKAGQAPKTSLRIQTQNGDYVRVESEFTSFVNPWSKKMEYITAQHEVIQGPCEIDVFGSPDPERSLMAIRKVRIYAKTMREQILKTMSELAEMTKQQTSRKNQNISNMMEKFMENPGPTLRPECFEKEPSLSEKSEVLAAISPHHDFYDGNSTSTDTSLSYNQMNYKENLQRFFESEPITGLNSHLQTAANVSISTDGIDNVIIVESDDDDEIFVFSFSSDNDENIRRLTQTALRKHNHEMEVALYKEHLASRYKPEKRLLSRQRLEHLARCNVYHENNMNAFVEPQQRVLKNGKNRLVDNAEASINLNSDRSQGLNIPWKREHLARAKRDVSAKKREQWREMIEGRQGQKRDMTFASISEKGAPYKQVKPAICGDIHCANINPIPAFNTQLYPLWPEQMNGYPPFMVSGSSQANDPTYAWTEHMTQYPQSTMGVPLESTPPQTNGYADVWAEQLNISPMTSRSPEINGQANVLSEQINMPSVTSRSPEINGQVNVWPEQINRFPSDYYHTNGQANVSEPTHTRQKRMISGSPQINGESNVWSGQINGYSQPMESGSPHTTSSYRMYYLREPVGIQSTNSTNIVPIMLYSNGYGNSIVYTPINSSLQYQTDDIDGIHFGNFNANGINTNGTNTNGSWDERSHVKNNYRSNDEPMSNSDQENNRTEGETSSSFYSTFLKMDSSGEEQGKSSSDKDTASRNRFKCMKWVEGQMKRTYSEDSHSETMHKNYRHYYTQKDKLIEPPWMKDVVPSDELFYRYQLPKVDENDVLEKDKEFLDNVQQSVEVNDQLGQLYVDLHLQGVTSKLTLEEGITSSGSSGEDSGPRKVAKRKRKPYGQMSMIFEEDAPFPPQEEIDMKDHYIPIRPLPAIVPSCSKDYKRVTKKITKVDNLETFYKSVDQNQSIEAATRDHSSDITHKK